MPAGKGSKGRKLGRNKIKCQVYRTQNRHAKNKLRKLLRHIKQHGSCPEVAAAIERLPLSPSERKAA